MKKVVAKGMADLIVVAIAVSIPPDKEIITEAPPIITDPPVKNIIAEGMSTSVESSNAWKCDGCNTINLGKPQGK